MDFLNNVAAVLEGTEMIYVILGYVIIGAFAMFAALFATKAGEKFLPEPSETRTSDFLPFEQLLEDGKTIRCHNGTLVRIYRLAGADLAFLSQVKRDGFLDARKKWIDTLGELDVEGAVFTLRERTESYDEAAHEIPILAKVAERWNQNMKKVYRNVHYVVMTVADRKDNYKDLNQASGAMEATLADYGPQIMIDLPDNTATDNPFYLYAQLINPITHPQPKITSVCDKETINDMLTADHVVFTKEEGTIRFFSGDKYKYCAVIGVRTAPDNADEQMLSDMLALNCEITIMSNFSVVPKMRAQALLVQQKRMAMMTSFSYGIRQQYDDALAMIEQGDEDYQSLVNFSQSFFVYADSKEELTQAVSDMERIFRLYGATPVREGWIAQATWFCMFPTYNKLPRIYKYLSRAAACSFNFERSAEGFDRCDWGPGPIALFKTAFGTVYRFQFHVSPADSAVAHTAAIGPTGQGKTTLYTFLASQAMRHKKLRIFFFDRHRGVEVFTYAVGGDYINFEGDSAGGKNDDDDEVGKGGKTVTLNPFRCEDTSENRSFLRRWLKAITMVDDPMSEQEIGRAVTTAFDYLPPRDRTLANLHKSCFSPVGHMRRELNKWVDPQQYGAIFNAQDDGLDMNARFTAFDFTYIFEDETLAPAVVSYVMNRIQNLTGATGDPSLIIIDETAPMLKHPSFRDNFIIGLQEGRKKRQAYLCAFQQPNIVDNLGVGEVIRGQCQSVIFFRNPQARPEDYANWNLTPKEMAFIQGKAFRDMKYAILLSRPAVGESVVLNTDIGSLGPYIRIYDSGRKQVLLAEELRKKYGNDNFLDHYLAYFS